MLKTNTHRSDRRLVPHRVPERLVILCLHGDTDMSEICIGRMCGGEGDWFATLDFDNREATVVRRGKRGHHIGPIAKVPLGDVWDGGDDHYGELMDDEQNRNLMLIVFAPEIVRWFRAIGDRAKKIAKDIDDVLDNPEMDRESILERSSGFLAEIESTMELLEESLTIPESNIPEHIAFMESQSSKESE